ncbi:UDP-sugar transporter [Nymphaea thermarum]|nr:UDP-sugar transporter [Nymphaea thermarum]
MASKGHVLPVSSLAGDSSRDESLFKGSGMTKRGAYAAVSYMTCAVLLVMFNKAALSSYNFPAANVITLLQAVVVRAERLPSHCRVVVGRVVLRLAMCRGPHRAYREENRRQLEEEVAAAVMHGGRQGCGGSGRCHIISSTSILYALKRWKIISFSVGDTWASDNSSPLLVPFETLLHTLPLSISYMLYMLATMESVRGVNVPMYTALRRTTVVFTMIVEYLLTGQKYSYYVVGSVGLIVSGAFIAGARDLSFDYYGYAMVFISNITTAIYLATIARIGKTSGLNSFGLMWCNGLVCGPLILLWTFIRGDLESTMQFPYLFTPGFQAIMLLSCVMAFFLNYSIFLNTTLNSALTQTMCGNLKDFFTVGIGWLLFGGLPFDILNVLGQSLGFVGSGFYAYCKLKGK